MRQRAAKESRTGSGREEFTRSSFESYIGIAIAVVTTVFSVNWILKVVFLSILLFAIGDVVFRAILKKLGNRWRTVVTAFIVLIFAAYFVRTVRNQYLEDKLEQASEEFAPSVLAQDDSANLSNKTKEFIAQMRILQRKLDSTYAKNNSEALKRENAGGDQANLIEAERERLNSELYKELGETFRDRYLTNARSLEGELLHRAHEIYIGPRGEKMPPVSNRFPARPSALEHGDLYGGTPFEDAAGYFGQLLSLL